MVVVACTSCGVRINVKDELLGRKAKCPKCATLIVLQAESLSAPSNPSTAAAPAAIEKPKPHPASPPPLPPATPIAEHIDELEEIDIPEAPRSAKLRKSRDFMDEDDNDRGRRRRRSPRDDDDFDDYDDRPEPPKPIKRSAWKVSHLGLRLVSWGTILGMCSSALFCILLIVAPRDRVGGGTMDVMLAVVAATGCLSFVAGLLAIAGMVLCGLGPQTPSRIFARVSAGCLAFALFFTLIAGVMGELSRDSDAGMGLSCVMLLVMSGGFVTWVLFHATLARHFRDWALQRQCYFHLGGAFIIGILTFGFIVTLMFLFRSHPSPRVATVAVIVPTILATLGIGAWSLVINHKTQALVR